MTKRIIPLIMCGGAGTRLWPASREVRPKQFLPLFGARSTFQDTLMRVSDPTLFERPIIITNAAYRFMVTEQLAEIGEYTEALAEYQKALGVNRISSLAHYRVGEVFFLQNNYQSAANEFREALNGDGEPKWSEVWSHINLGKIFDMTQQRERARNDYQQAIRTKDNTQGAQEQAAKYLQTPYVRKETN